MIDDLIAVVREAAHEQIVPRLGRVGRRRKADGSVLTEADVAMQSALVERLRAIRDLPMLGEEMTRAEQEARWADRDGLWCIDPIDGTSNFVNGIPYFAVSVARLEGGRPVAGVVYNPVSEELFAAERGGGAFLNGERLPLRPGAERLAEAIAGVDLKRLATPLATALAASPPYHSQRNFGAGTLEWCFLAAGRLDVYLHGGQHLWDLAAGSLILEEAGGSMATLDQDDLWAGDGLKRSVVAALDRRAFAAWRDWVRRASAPKA